MTSTTSEDIRQLGAVLVVGAHPDDEIFIAGGIMACCAQNGQRVACVTATLGELGTQDETRWPVARLAQIRAAELAASMKVLGVRDWACLGYPDGQCIAVDLDLAAERVDAAVRAFRPDTILTFGPDGLTGHPDHQAVSWWVDATAGDARVLWAALEVTQFDQLREANQDLNIFFATDRPPVVRAPDLALDFQLRADVTDLKRRAFEAVPSQMERLLDFGLLARPGEALARECFVAAKIG